MRTTYWYVAFCGEGKLPIVSIHLITRSLQIAVIQQNTVKAFLYGLSAFCIHMAYCAENKRFAVKIGWRQRFTFPFFLPFSPCAESVPHLSERGVKIRWRLAFTFFFTATIWFSIRFQAGWRVKAKKRKLADVRVYACVREESWGGASQTRLVFFDSPRVSSRISGDLDSIVEKRGQTYCIREIKWYLCKQHDLPRFP